MKKIVLVLCVLVLVLSTFAGCGSKGDDSKESGSDTSIENIAEIKEFVEQNKKTMDVLNESTKGTLEMSVAAENNKIVFTNKYFQDFADEEESKRAMDNAMKQQEATMYGVIKQLKALDIENPVVVLRCLNSKSEEIASYEFK